jgi:DNA-binding CsgD family transcriptional regulator
MARPGYHQGLTHKERIISLLESTTSGLDDDEIAERLDISPRQTVNGICRELAKVGVIRRIKEPGSKIVNCMRVP